MSIMTIKLLFKSYVLSIGESTSRFNILLKNIPKTKFFNMEINNNFNLSIIKLFNMRNEAFKLFFVMKNFIYY